MTQDNGPGPVEFVPAPKEFTINSQALAGITNVKCMGELVKGSGTIRFISHDGQWKFDVPLAFGGFVAPDEDAIVSITLLKNGIVEKPVSTGNAGKIIKPGQ